MREAVTPGVGGARKPVRVRRDPANSTPATAKAVTGEPAISRPPTAGPVIMASWLPAELNTMARGSSARLTRVGARAVAEGA